MTMTPEEIHHVLETRLAAAQAQVDQSRAKLQAAEQAHAATQSSYQTLQSTYKTRLESFNAYLDEQNKKKMVIGFAMILGGVAGWYLQKKFDYRLPAMALVGGGVAVVSTMLTDDETTQNALQFGGLSMALTSVLFVFQLPKSETTSKA